MNCQLSASHLPAIWVIETLAQSNEVDIPLLLDLLEKFPQTSDSLGRKAREMVSFRILENFLFRGLLSNTASSSSSPKIAFDPSESCEDVLKQILLETPSLNLKASGPEMGKWDVQAFIAHKRSSLDSHTLLQLKEAILTQSNYFLASFKERSGLPSGNQPEHGHWVDDDKCSGIAHIFEGTDSKTDIGKGNDQFCSPAFANDSYLLHSDFPNENLLAIKRKTRATTKNVGKKPGKDRDISKNSCENHTKYHKDAITQCEQDLGGNLKSSLVNKQLADKTMIIAQYSGREKCSFVGNIHIGEIGLNELVEDPNNESVSLKGLGGPTEVLPHEKQAPHCNTELLNVKSDYEHGLENEIREEKGARKGVSDLKYAEDLDKSKPAIKANVQNGAKEGITGDTQSTCIQYSSATKWEDLNMLADVCGRLAEASEVIGHSLKNKTCLGNMKQNGPPGDVDNERSSSKGLIGNENVVCHEQLVHHDGIKVPDENFDDEKGQVHDAGGKEGSDVLKTPGVVKDRFEQESHQSVPDLLSTEDFDLSSGSDERSHILTKKNAFLSSQCTSRQAADISTQLNICMKCNEGGKLLVCSTNSCPLVIHESCCGTHGSFDTNGDFYCPFCAYSLAISKYMVAKKEVSMARKNFSNFVCLGTRKKFMKQPDRSSRIKHHHLENHGLHKSNDLNHQDIAEHINNDHHRRKLECVQTNFSTLSPGGSHSLGGKTVDSTNRKPQPSNKDEKGRENKRQMLKSNQSEINAGIRSKMGVLHSPPTDSPHECKCPPPNGAVGTQERSEEEREESGVSRYSIRDQKYKIQHAHPEILQLRRRRVPWTTAEVEKLKEGMRTLCSHRDKCVPWKKILDFGAGVFEESRSTIDLKDKWRNLCKASSPTPKS